MEVVMGLLKRLDHHSELMENMAQTLGVDLSDALTQGRLAPSGLRDAMLACVCCTGADECPGWLAKHADGADHAPGYCRNGALFDRLRD